MIDQTGCFNPEYVQKWLDVSREHLLTPPAETRSSAPVANEWLSRGLSVTAWASE